eukprot:1369458-Amorphochlora_amoeboformis.AAC.1
MERIAGGATPTGNSGHTMSSTIVTPAGSAIAMDGGGSREGAEGAEAGSGDKGKKWRLINSPTQKQKEEESFLL